MLVSRPCTRSSGWHATAEIVEHLEATRAEFAWIAATLAQPSRNRDR
jgi:hypothetical protein